MKPFLTHAACCFLSFIVGFGVSEYRTKQQVAEHQILYNEVLRTFPVKFLITKPGKQPEWVTEEEFLEIYHIQRYRHPSSTRMITP